MSVFNYGNAVLSAAGDTKKPLYFLSMAGVINILLNLFFVIVCHLAAAGVALASIISQYISAALVICPCAVRGAWCSWNGRCCGLSRTRQSRCCR